MFYHISNHWEEYTTCSRVRTLYFCVGNVWKRFKTNKLAKLYTNKNQMSILVMRIPLFQLENLLMHLRRTQKLLFWCLWLLTGKLLYKLKTIFSTQCEVQDAKNWTSDLQNKWKHGTNNKSTFNCSLRDLNGTLNSRQGQTLIILSNLT